MHMRTWLAAALAIVGALSIALAAETRSTQAGELRALAG